MPIRGKDSDCRLFSTEVTQDDKKTTFTDRKRKYGNGLSPATNMALRVIVPSEMRLYWRLAARLFLRAALQDIMEVLDQKSEKETAVKMRTLVGSK